MIQPRSLTEKGQPWLLNARVDRALGWIPLEQTKLSFEKHWIFLLIASQPAVLG
jgi:hypothetical protein